MSVIVAGTVRVPPENLAVFREHMVAMIEGSRAESGCLIYSYAEDVLEPGLIRIFEIWRDQIDLDTHGLSTHMGQWRAAWPQFGVTERHLSVFDVTDQRPL